MGIGTVVVKSRTGAYDRVKKGEPVITAYPTSGTKEEGIILGEPQDFPLDKEGILAERTLALLPSELKLDKYIALLNNAEMFKVSQSKIYQYNLFPNLIPKTVAI